MRHLVIVLALPFVLIASTHTAGAQTRAHMLIGVSGYTVTGDNVDMDPVYRLSGGGGVTIPLEYGLAIRTELKYTVQGGKTKGTIASSINGQPADIPVTATFDLTYLEIPIMLTAGVELPNGVRLEAGAGPGIGFKADTRWRLAAETGIEFDEAISEAPGRITGLAFTADLILPVRGELMLLGVRGWLSSTNTGLGQQLPGSGELRTRGLSLVTGVLF